MIRVARIDLTNSFIENAQNVQYNRNHNQVVESYRCNVQMDGEKIYNVYIL